MLSTLVVATILGGIQQSDPVLDLKFTAMTLSDLMVHLSERTDETFSVNEELGDELVSMRLKDASVSEIKRYLADVVFGRWVPRSEGVELIEDGDRLRSIRNQHDQVVAQKVSTSLESIRRVQNGQFPANLPKDIIEEGGERLKELWSDPGFRLWMLCALQVPSSVYNEVREGDRMAFSTSPLPGQGRLNANQMSPLVNTILEEMGKSIRSLNDEYGSVEETYGSDIEREFAELIQEIYGSYYPLPEPPKQAAKIVAVVTSDRPKNPLSTNFVEDDPSLPNIHVNLVAADGTIILAYEENLEVVLQTAQELIWYKKWEEEEDEPTETESEEVDRTPFVKIDQSTRDYVLTIQRRYRGESKEFNNMWMRPAEYEPLEWAVGKPLMALAEQMDKEYVSVLEDNWVFRFAYSLRVAPELRESEFEKYFTVFQDGELRTIQKDGIYFLYPDEVLLPNRNRINRQHLQQLLLTREETGVVPLDMLASFAAAHPGAEEQMLILYHDFLDSRMSARGLLGNESEPRWKDYVLWGMLSPSQRGQLRGGQRVAVRNLSEPVRRLLLSDFYAQEISLGNLAETHRKNSWQAYFDDLFQPENWVDVRSFGVETSELLPGGFPAGAYLQARILKEDYLIPATSDGVSEVKVKERSLDEFLLDRSLADYFDGEFHSQMGLDDLQPYWLGRQTQIELDCIVRPGTGITYSYTDLDPPDRSQTYTAKTLPESVSTAIAAKDEQMRSSKYFRLFQVFAEYMMGVGGNDEVIKPLD